MRQGHPPHNKSNSDTLALACRLLLGRTATRDVVAATGLSDSTVRRMRLDLGLGKVSTYAPPPRPRLCMAITPRGVADDFLALPRPDDAPPAGYLRAHLGTPVHQLPALEPVAKPCRIPDLAGLLATHPPRNPPHE